MEPPLYKLTALSDEHPSWNSEMEAWWQNGGALLWNRFGGVTSEELVLNRSDAKEFVRRASAIPGWNSLFHEECIETGCLPGEANAVKIENMFAGEEPSRQCSPSQEEPLPSLCCRDCGRDIHPFLQRLWSEDEFTLPKHVLNHLLNSLNEAIDFSRGKGPNNWLVWQAALEEAARLLADGDNG